MYYFSSASYISLVNIIIAKNLARFFYLCLVENNFSKIMEINFLKKCIIALNDTQQIGLMNCLTLC